jgi:uncharacterized membrane protein YdjX (TVP38/TMEM64 family)
MLLRRHHALHAEKIDQQPIEQHKHTLRKIALRCLAGGVILLALYLLIHFLKPVMPDVRALVTSLGFWGPLAYCLLFIIFTSVFFPESILAIAAGTLFGFWLGILWVVVAGTIGALLIFVMARQFFMNPARHYLEQHPKLLAFDKAAGSEGFKLMFLLRLAPVNYTLLCYLLSVSSAKFKPYALACIGMFPGNISTVYMGFAARHVTEVAAHETETSWVSEVSIYAGLVFTIAASAFVAKIAMKTVKKMQSTSDSTPKNCPET